MEWRPVCPTTEGVQEVVDERIWLINDLGQYELLSDDLSKDENYIADQTEEITELSAVVNYIARVSKTVPFNLPDKPWLEPLETAIISPQTDIHWTDEKSIGRSLCSNGYSDRTTPEGLSF